MNTVRDDLWAPVRAAIEQVVDAIAALPVEVQLEHGLSGAVKPGVAGDDFRLVFRARHPAAFEALEQAVGARNKAYNEAKQQEAKERRLAGFKRTMAKKKAAREAAQKP